MNAAQERIKQLVAITTAADDQEFYPDLLHSSALNFCLQKIVYNQIFEYELMPSAPMITGKMLHNEMLEGLARAVWPGADILDRRQHLPAAREELRLNTVEIERSLPVHREHGGIQCHLDFRVYTADANLVIDLKTTSKQDLLAEGTLIEAYKSQVNLYAYLDEAPAWELWVYHIRSEPLWEVIIGKTSAGHAQYSLETADYVLGEIHKNAQFGLVPHLVGPQYRWECSYCQWNDRCPNVTTEREQADIIARYIREHDYPAKGDILAYCEITEHDFAKARKLVNIKYNKSKRGYYVAE